MILRNYFAIFRNSKAYKTRTTVMTAISPKINPSAILSEISGIKTNTPNITNKVAVHIFPYHFAPSSFFPRRRLISPITAIKPSLTAIKLTSHIIRLYLLHRHNATAACVSLSAKGSTNFPSSVTILNFLATFPSNKSVIVDTRTTPAAR